MIRKLLFFSLGFAFTVANGQNLFSFGFDGTTANMLAAGWQVTNQSTPIYAGAPTWSIASYASATSTTPFGGTSSAGQSGGFNSLALVNYTSTGTSSTTGSGTISNWLITPSINVVDGDVVTFWSRKGTSGTTDYPDRLELRMSTAASTVVPSTGASDVGSFTTVALTINPTLAGGFIYPKVWTQYTYTVSGVPTPTDVKFAFRYFVTNGGPAGANSDIIGIDTFSVDRTLSTQDFFAKNFTLYPNPANNVLNLSSKSNTAIETVQVLDLNGRVVKNTTVNGMTDAQVNVADLNAGMYFVEVVTNEGKATSKFMKN